MSLDDDTPIWTPEALSQFSGHERDAVRRWAADRIALLHPELSAAADQPAPRVLQAALARLGAIGGLLNDLASAGPDAPVDGPAQGTGTARLDDAAAHPGGDEDDDTGDPDDDDVDDEPRRIPDDEAAALRAEAEEHLGGPDEDRNIRLLRALRGCRWRWAPALLASRFDALLRTPAAPYAWDAAEALASPALLDAAIDAWRPDEWDSAAAVELIATVCGRAADLPEGLLADAAQRLTPLEARPLDLPLRLPLRCEDCGRTYTYPFGSVAVDIDHARSVDRARSVGEDGPGWDGLLPDRIVTCKGCGAVDRYRATGWAYLQVMSELVGARINPTFEPRVAVGGTTLWDGTRVRRTSEGIAYLRAWVEAHPDDSKGWWRLGNLCDRGGLEDEAEAAWLRACQDPSETQAACALMELYIGQDRKAEAVTQLAEAIRRFPHARWTDQERAEAANLVCAVLGAVTPLLEPPLALEATWIGGNDRGRPFICLSKLDLREIPSWSRLEELMADGWFASMRLTHELPTDPDSQLRDLLEPPRSPQLRIGPKVGRNDACPCGSGKKFKRCCL